MLVVLWHFEYTWTSCNIVNHKFHLLLQFIDSLSQGGGGQHHHSHVALGLCEVALPHNQFLHMCTAPSQTDMLISDLKDHSEVLRDHIQYWDKGSQALDMCQDEWWLYHSIFQWLCSEGMGARDLDTHS